MTGMRSVVDEFLCFLGVRLIAMRFKDGVLLRLPFQVLLHVLILLLDGIFYGFGFV